LVTAILRRSGPGFAVQPCGKKRLYNEIRGQNTMRRRDMFKLTAGATMLAAPRIAQAKKSCVSRFVGDANAIVSTDV
jgi:hypothetical protein